MKNSLIHKKSQFFLTSEENQTLFQWIIFHPKDIEMLALASLLLSSLAPADKGKCQVSLMWFFSFFLASGNTLIAQFALPWPRNKRQGHTCWGERENGAASKLHIPNYYIHKGSSCCDPHLHTGLICLISSKTNQTFINPKSYMISKILDKSNLKRAIIEV